MEDQLDNIDVLLLILIGKKACSIRELAKETFKAVGTIQGRLNNLQRKGYVNWIKGQHRSIHLTTKGANHVHRDSRVSTTQA